MVYVDTVYCFIFQQLQLSDVNDKMVKLMLHAMKFEYHKLQLEKNDCKKKKRIKKCISQDFTVLT